VIVRIFNSNLESGVIHELDLLSFILLFMLPERPTTGILVETLEI